MRNFGTALKLVIEDAWHLNFSSGHRNLIKTFHICIELFLTFYPVRQKMSKKLKCNFCDQWSIGFHQIPYYVNTCRGGGGIFCLHSDWKVLKKPKRLGGGPKSLKMFLRSIWMVPWHSDACALSFFWASLSGPIQAEPSILRMKEVAISNLCKISTL